MMAAELPVIAFASAAAWEAWLEENHASSPGVWLKIGRRGAAVPSVSYRMALEWALCYGWIDRQKGTLDDTFWRVKFTPREPISAWSMHHRDETLRLLEQGRMRPAGLREFEEAQADGRLDAGNAWVGSMEVPPDLQAALASNPEAATFFATLDTYSRSVVLHQIMQAKNPKARRKRIAQMVAILARGEKVNKWIWARIARGIQECVRLRRYIVTLHAVEQMDDEGLSVFDLEQIVLTGKTVERRKERPSGPWNYLISGETINTQRVTVVVRMRRTGTLVFATVYGGNAK